MVRRKQATRKKYRSANSQETSSKANSESRPSTSKSTMQTMSTNYRNDKASSSRTSKSTVKSTEIVAVAREDNTIQTMTTKTYINIKRLQASTSMLIPKLAFSRLVREIIMTISPRTDWRIQKEALQALQESCELYMTQFFEDSYLCTFHAKRQTLFVHDMYLARRLRGRDDVINH